MESHRRIQSRLSAERGQNGLRSFSFNNASDGFRLDGFYVGSVSEFRIRHDGGGIRIHQHHFIALFLQSFDRLSARIIKLAGLSDDNGAATDDENFFNVRSFWHSLNP